MYYLLTNPLSVSLQGPIGFPGDLGAPGEAGVNVSISSDVSQTHTVIGDDETSRLSSQGIDGSAGSKGDHGDPGKSVSLF